MNLYKNLSYKEAISDCVRFRKEMDSKANFSQLATALKVESSFLSKVFKGKLHFNSDQIYTACKHLALSAEESEFLLLLWEYERASLAERKSELLREIKKIQAENRTTRKALKAATLRAPTQEEISEYYLNPYVGVVHTLLTISKYQTNPRLIATKVGIAAVEVEKALVVLKKLGIIQQPKPGAPVEVLQRNLHLNSDSPYVGANLSLYKMIACAQMLRIPREQRYSYSVTLSIDQSTRDWIQEEFIQLLKKVEERVIAAPSEKSFEMSFDLFPWELDET